MTSLIWCKQRRVVRKPEINSVQSSVTVQWSAHWPSRQQNASQSITYPTGCEGCGSTKYGPGTNKPLKKHCPARIVSCEFCHIVGHLAKVFVKRGKATHHRPLAMLLPPLVRLVRRHHQVIWQRPVILKAMISQTPHPHGLATMTDDEKQFTTSLHNANSSAWSHSDRPRPHGSNLHHKLLIPNME